MNGLRSNGAGRIDAMLHRNIKPRRVILGLPPGGEPTMFENVSTQFVSLGKQVAENAFKAQLLALESAERVADLQLKTLESRVNATMAFFGQAAEVRDFDAAKAFWPQSINLVRESAEQMVSTAQEVLSQNLKTSEAIGQMVRAQYDAVSEGVAKNAKAPRQPAAAAK